MKVLKFYADYCAPCKAVGHYLKKANLPIEIVEVDAEDNDDMVREYGIRSVPVTVLLDDDGREIRRWTGVFDVDELKRMINETADH
jgi:thioredoxin 1